MKELSSIFRKLHDDSDVFFVAAGGSTLTGDATPSSDLDLFVIGNKQKPPRFSNLGDVDIEYRSKAWLLEAEKKLLNYTPKIGGELPPVGYFDMRFLVRIILGKELISDEETAKLLRSTSSMLWEPLNVYSAITYVNVYQDVVGFILGDRIIEAELLCGELVQRACQMALLQFGLVDPSPKYALRRCFSHQNSTVNTLATQLVSSIHNLRGDPSAVEQLLRLCNAIVGAATLVKHVDQLNSTAAVLTPQPMRDMRYCLSGMLGYYTLQDVVNQDIFICRPAALASFVEEQLDRQAG
ncbi:MAG: nucleotidyltransferase domain-containing protein [Kordiimonas sp.]